MFRLFKVTIILMAAMVFILACNLTSVVKKTTEEKPAEGVSTEIPAAAGPTPEQTTASPPVETAPVEEPSPIPIVHLTSPSNNPPGEAQVIHDQESIRKAAVKEAYGGDEFYKGRYERPFDLDMNYVPFIDIQQANLFRDENDDYIYGVIRLMEDPALMADAAIGLGIEVDTDLEGRGDVLIWTKRPLDTKWSVEGVSVWKDANKSVGGLTPMRNDPPPGGDGYEVKIFDAGVGADPDLAWSRISPQDPKFVEIAFKKAALGETEVFLWGAWSILGDNPFGIFDHHDHFTYEEAGSPMKSEAAYYPLKGMFALDNTCRAASGYTSKGGEPGVCPVSAPPVQSGGDEPPQQNCRQICYNFGSQTVCTQVCQ